jgi:hypothetical protein
VAFYLQACIQRPLLMRSILNKRKACRVLLAALCGVILSANVDAADFLFFWSASTNPSVTAYGIYQRTGDSSYVKIDEVSVQDLDNPAHPTYWITGLAEGSAYWFAASSISDSGTESELANQTCITVNGEIVECTDNNENGSTVYISCFITAAGR